MSEPTVSHVDLVARIDADDIVKGLNNNDGLILQFILDMLEHAGSSELEDDLRLRINERLGIAAMPGAMIQVVSEDLS